MTLIGVPSENILLAPWEPKLLISFRLGCWEEYKTFKSLIVSLFLLASGSHSCECEQQGTYKPLLKQYTNLAGY